MDVTRMSTPRFSRQPSGEANETGVKIFLHIYGKTKTEAIERTP
jgi:hypothetical protein